MNKKLKVRLDKLIVEKGLAPDIRKAQALILAGTVEIKGRPQPKPGDLVGLSELITLKEYNPYVSRGGLKLASFLEKCNISCEGKACMDIGASTGGFTDCLLQHGAVSVYAVDVGKGLLDSRLVKDPRVVNIENTNFRYFSDLNLKHKIEFVTIDVSFISLEKILPKAARILAPGGQMVAMVKPQFEAERRGLIKGVVKDEGLRLAAIGKIKSFCEALGLEILQEANSSVKGPSGNIEHFLCLKAKNAD